MRITGKVISKRKRIHPVRAEIVIHDKSGEPLVLELMPKYFDRLVNIDVGADVAFLVKNELTETQIRMINNLTVIDAQKL